MAASIAPLYGAAAPAEAKRLLSSYQHRAWRIDSGAPPDIWALAQSTDGFLWLATGNGLFQFDGVTFDRVALPDGQHFLSNNMTALTILPSGVKWIGYHSEGISALDGQNITNYGPNDGVPTGAVYSISQDFSGVLWAAFGNGLGRFADGRWSTVGDSWDFHSSGARWTFVDSRGTLWVATDHSIEMLRRGSTRFEATGVSDTTLAVIGEAPGGVVWMSDWVHGTRPLTSSGGEPLPAEQLLPVAPALKEVRASRLLFDDTGVLWVTDRVRGGVVRMSSLHEASQLADQRSPSPFETFGAVDGLTTDLAVPLLEDREGNIWVGTNLGLNQFRRRSVFTLAGLAEARANRSYGLASGQHGEVVLAVGERLFQTNGTMTHQLMAGLPTVLSACMGPDGSLWLKARESLWRLHEGSLTSIRPPRDGMNLHIRAMTTDASGALWASIEGQGVYQFRNDSWEPVEPSFGAANVISSDLRGRIWFGYANNRVAVLEGNQRREYSERDGLAVGNVTALYVRGDLVIVAGENGLAQQRGNHFVSLAAGRLGDFLGITGIIETQDHTLWLNGWSGIVRISTAALRAALDEPSQAPVFTLFGSTDGLPGIAVQANAVSTALEAADGKLWFATNQGIAWIDPAQLNSNPSLPSVSIRKMIAGEQTYGAREPLVLPKRTNNVEIDFTATSLTVPERVQFRYKLDRVDDNWRDAGPRRQAFYTKLDPGPYAFHVIAANDDGIWNNDGATFHFEISPMFFQTRWFAASCLGAGIATLWLLYIYRLRQLTSRLRGRMEERLMERERIARDLHDNLLQSIQGLIYRFQAATERLPPDEPVRDVMILELDRADIALSEGRDQIVGLRKSTLAKLDLPEALTAFAENMAVNQVSALHISMQGRPRALHPLVREEMHRIGCEALTNAFNHAKAAHIELEIVYGHGEFSIRVRDDGVGLDAAIVAAGERPGHFGLVGMRERARNVRAHVDVWSRRNAGTEVVARVSSAIAYHIPRGAA